MSIQIDGFFYTPLFIVIIIFVAFLLLIRYLDKIDKKEDFLPIFIFLILSSSISYLFTKNAFLSQCAVVTLFLNSTFLFFNYELNENKNKVSLWLLFIYVSSCLSSCFLLNLEKTLIIYGLIFSALIALIFLLIKPHKESESETGYTFTIWLSLLGIFIGATNVLASFLYAILLLLLILLLSIFNNEKFNIEKDYKKMIYLSVIILFILMIFGVTTNTFAIILKEFTFWFKDFIIK